MRISVKVHPKSSQKKVVIVEDIYHVYINLVPEDGKANIALISDLADYFGISKQNISIVSGHNSKNKIIEIV